MDVVFRALGHPVRRQIVVMLRDRALTSGQIANEFNLAWPSISAHLSVLKDAGLIDAERDGTSIYYRLNISAPEEAVGFLLSLFGARSADPDIKGDAE